MFSRNVRLRSVGMVVEHLFHFFLPFVYIRLDYHTRRR